MDGTLFQTEKNLELSLEDAFNHLRALDRWAEDTPIKKYREIMGVPLPKVWETLLPNHSKETRNKMDNIFQESLIKNVKRGENGLYPNAVEILSYLKGKNYSIFIASNGLMNYLSAIVESYNLNKLVCETFSIEQIDSLSKSDLVKHIKAKYGISQGAVVGDRISDFGESLNTTLIKQLKTLMYQM